MPPFPFVPVKLPLAKRLLDIVVTLLLLFLLSPFMALIALLMFGEGIFVASSRGAIFYSEQRISQGRPFVLRKFRIFKQAALRSALRQNGFIETKELENDSRNLTGVGRLLKKIYMDELPQFWNVLKGELSLVGPRPTNSLNAQRWLREGKYSKHLIKAGVTGYFQSHKGRKLQRDQDEMDMEYINFVRQNPGWKVVLFDMKILVISLYTILRAEGI